MLNHLFWDGLVPLIGREKALIWPRKLNLIQKSYHGEVFEGNACRTLLKNADLLNDSEIYENVGLLQLVPYINVVKAMNKLVDCCFSSTVGDDLEKHVKEFKKMCEATDLSTTLKLHVVFEHITDCLKYMNKNGLGTCSEQAGETIHSEFLIHWNRRKINSLEDPNYIIKLKKSVVAFSSLNI